MNGVEYYDAAYTGPCSGCDCDCAGDGRPCGHGAGGCDECGYTGKRVRHFPVAFDPAETERMHRMELPTAASGDENRAERGPEPEGREGGGRG